MIKDCIRKGLNLRAGIRSAVNKRSNRKISANGVDLAINQLVERDGEARSFHVERVDGKTLKPIMKEQIHENTRIMTDDMGAYSKIDQHFSSHEVVRHSKKEYVRGVDIHTNTVEGFFSILKRGLDGVYQFVMSHHLNRYIKEFDFRYTHRKISDMERTTIALRNISGRRLYYLSPVFC